MPTRITFGTSLRRALRDTRQRFDLHHPGPLLINALIFALTTFFFSITWGRGQVMEELRWPIMALAAFGLVALASLLANLILAPFRLARESELAAEQEKADAEGESTALRAKVAVLEAQKAEPVTPDARPRNPRAGRCVCVR